MHERLGEWPLPTMQLGVITARAVAFARRLASRGVPPSVLERGEVLEVYPRATQRRLEPRHPDLRPRARGEAKVVYGQRVAPPPDFNLASGWIWMPRTTEGAPPAVIDPDGV